ncbi:MAG TPA: PriCT-2 domain-containing protein [Pyrinomonadaceae bacterium]|jgi:hypothetical protein
MVQVHKAESLLTALWGDDAQNYRAIFVGQDKKHYFFSTNSEALQKIEELNNRRQVDIYYAPTLFSKNGRKQENAVSCRALYLDVDTGENKPYKTLTEAQTAINSFLQTTGLPEPIRVCSGNGYHLYWIFEQTLAKDEWREKAKGLKQLCELHNFKADGQVTGDIARLLRVPNTLNVKNPQEPKKCELLNEIKIHSVDSVCGVLEKAGVNRDLQTAQAINSAFLSEIETNPAEAQELAERCLQHLSREKCDSRELWLKVGFALRNTFNGSEKGLDLWREWSKQSPKYIDGCCDDIWHSNEREKGEKITVGTLIKWACEDSAEFREFWNERTGKTETSEKPTQATRLLSAIMSRLELFHTAEGECFASVQNAGHQETYKLSSRSFKDWLSYESYRQEGKTPNAQTMTDVIQTLTGKARFDSPQTEVFLRVAEKDDAIYVDLCDETWRVVEITKAGWRVLNHSPVKFRRTKGMLALPEPLPGGILTRLKDFINVCESDFVLVLAWLVGCFCYNKPYPVLILHGEQGSAKSTTSRTLRRLVDPNKADLREKPKENRDLMIAANNGYVVAYDNLSSLSPELSDSMCRLATGGGFSTRELYSNDEETIFDVVRPLILNGIEETVSRSDLLDRALIIECPRITEQSRKTEAECKSSFASEHGKLLGALFDAVSCALRELPNVKLERLPRMADFAKWACAAEPAFNLPGRTFLARYESNRATAHAVTLDSSPIGKALVGFMQGKTVWQGTAEELRGLLTSGFDNGLTGFPKTAKALGGAIKRLSPTLRANGFDITSQRANNARTITITKQM